MNSREQVGRSRGRNPPPGAGSSPPPPLSPPVRQHPTSYGPPTGYIPAPGSFAGEQATGYIPSRYGHASGYFPDEYAPAYQAVRYDHTPGYFPGGNQFGYQHLTAGFSNPEVYEASRRAAHSASDFWQSLSDDQLRHIVETGKREMYRMERLPGGPKYHETLAGQPSRPTPTAPVNTTLRREERVPQQPRTGGLEAPAAAASTAEPPRPRVFPLKRRKSMPPENAPPIKKANAPHFSGVSKPGSAKAMLQSTLVHRPKSISIFEMASEQSTSSELKAEAKPAEQQPLKEKGALTRIEHASEKPAPSAAAMKAPKEEGLPKSHPVPKAGSSSTQNMAKPGFPFTATSSAATPSSAKGTGFYSKPLYDPPEPEVRPELDLSNPKSLLELQPFLLKEAEEWCGFYHTPGMDYKCRHEPCPFKHAALAEDIDKLGDSPLAMTIRYGNLVRESLRK